MNSDPSWLDSLSPSTAPEFPRHLAEALRTRRRKRRLGMAKGVGGAAALGLALTAAWNSYQTPRLPPLPIAERPDPGPTPEPAQAPDVTIASIYGRDLGLDRLASDSPAGQERQFRIGDHWDPQQVEAWVLE